MTRDGEGQGHYICDVKCNESNNWFRTNDNMDAVSISSNSVTQKGAVLLYKRKC